MGALLFIGGNAVSAGLQWTLKSLSPFSPDFLLSDWLARLPGQRALTVSAAGCFTYTLAQCLALFSLFLASAFVQITIKVRVGHSSGFTRSPFQ